MSQRAILWGVMRYEYRMQIRRRSLWIVFAGIALLLTSTVLGNLAGLEQNYAHMPLLQLVGSVTVDINWLPIIAIGLFLADRFPRDRTAKVDELFESTVGRLNTRLAGKYLGSVLATLAPAFLVYFIVMCILAFYRHTLLVFPISLITYTAIVLPGVCFVAAFTLACTAWMWVPLYQFLFIGYWFWGNMLGPRVGLPTLAITILTPEGSFIGAGIFGSTAVAWIKDVPPLEGFASMLLLLLISLLVMILFYRYLKWEQSRK